MFGSIKKQIEDFFVYFKRSCVTLKKPIFIWGTGRSGTHLIYDIMSLHPDLCFVKAYRRWKKGLWGTMHYGDTTPEELRGYPIPVEGMLSIWEPAGIGRKFYSTLKRDYINKINREVVSANYMRLALEWKWEKTDKKYRILDKTPTFIMMVELIDAIFPDSYHIFCIRDPRAVVNSILRIARFTSKNSYEKEYCDGFFSNIYPDGFEKLIGKTIVEVLCWQIEQLISIGIKYVTVLKDRLILFRYEELLNNAHDCADYLFDKTELSRFNEIHNLIPKKFPDYSPDWPRNDKVFFPTKEVCFSNDELKYFENLECLAHKLGYDTDKVGKIVKPINLYELVDIEKYKNT